MSSITKTIRLSGQADGSIEDMAEGDLKGELDGLMER